MERILRCFLMFVVGALVIFIIFTFSRIIIRIYKNNDMGINIETKNEENDMSSTMKAVVIEVNDRSLMVMSVNNEEAGSIVSCMFAKEGNIGFKMGQEILIHYDGTILMSYPGHINKVGKIEIIKEKSEIEIPVDYMRYCYSRLDNVSVTVDYLISTGISFTITDNNEYKYSYNKDYVITKKNKEAEEENKEIEERNRKIIEKETKKQNEEDKGKNYVSAFNGDGLIEPLKKVWEEVPKISNVKSEDTGLYSENGNVYTRTYNWSNMYGQLGEGEYKFKTTIKDNFNAYIEISFSIDKNGIVTYSKPVLENG